MGGDRVPGPFNDAVDERDRERREAIERTFGGIKDGKGIEGALERAKTAWIAEFGRLDEVAVDVFHGRRGGFIRKYADAWLAADVWNKLLMRPVWESLIRKYDLEEDPTGTVVSEVREDP